MKKEKTFTILIYIFGPLIRYFIVSELVAAAMEFVWDLYLRESVLQGGSAAWTHTAVTMWSLLHLALSAGAGCLSVRSDAQSEWSAFAASHRDNRLLRTERVRVRVMPLLLSAAVFLSLGINVLFSCYVTGAGSQQTEGNLPGPAGILLQALFYCFYIPFIEETVFRGIFYPRLQRWYGTWAAVLVSAAFFGIYHGSPVQGVYAFVMGILFAAAYEGSGRFSVPCALHGACNLAILCLQWTDSYSAVCRPAWALVFLGVAAGGFLTIYRIIKKTAE